MIQQGQHVRVLFRNGTLIEGVVDEWLDDYVQLISITDQSVMIILHPKQDIMMVKILLDIPEELKPSQTKVTKSEHEPRSTSAAEQFQKLHNEPGDVFDMERNKSLAELRTMMNEEERQIIAHKLKTHFPSQVARPTYQLPNIFNKKQQ